jgi:ribosome-associated translation inhibitor RaiA
MVQPHITYLSRMPHSAALDAKIGELSVRLQDLHPRITSIHVYVDEVDKHKEQGRLFEVRVDVKAPRVVIVANHQRHEDPYVATRDAFDVALRQLTETLDRQRGDVKHHANGRDDEATT